MTDVIPALEMGMNVAWLDRSGEKPAINWTGNRLTRLWQVEQLLDE